MTLDLKPASPVAAMRICGVEPPSVAVAAVLEKFYGRPGTPEQLEVWRQIGQKRWWGLAGATWKEEPYSTLVLCNGRRGFKTTTDGEIVSYEVVFGGHEAFAAPGSRIYYVTIANTMRQARESVRAQKTALDRYARFGISYTQRDPSGATELVVHDPRTDVEKVVTVMVANDASLRGYAIACLVLDEAAFLPTDPHLATTDREILNAARPAMAQFPNAKLIVSSTPGPTQGLFFDWVNKPPPGALLVRAPTWVMNPRVSEARCLKLANGDARVFDQEYAARRFGSSGESLLDEELWMACLDPHGQPFDYSSCPALGPPPSVIGGDTGLQSDSTTCVRARCEYRAVGNGAPVLHVTIDLCEEYKARSRKEPLSLEKIADRFAQIWGQSGKPLIRHDNHYGPELQRMLRARTGVDSEIVVMTNAAQAERVTLVCELVRGNRLHISGERAEELIRQFANLKVTQLSGGKLRIEGKTDDLADAAFLAIEEAASGKLAPTGHGGLRRVYDPTCRFDREQGCLVFPSGRSSLFHWERQVANGEWIECDPPRGSPEFEPHAIKFLDRSGSNDEIDAWLLTRPDVARRYGR